MDTIIEQPSQIERFKAQLKAIRKSISKEDRLAAMAAAGVNYVTLSTYMNGKGNSVDTSKKILDCLNKLIQKREKSLAK